MVVARQNYSSSRLESNNTVIFACGGNSCIRQGEMPVYAVLFQGYGRIVPMFGLVSAATLLYLAVTWYGVWMSSSYTYNPSRQFNVLVPVHTADYRTQSLTQVTVPVVSDIHPVGSESVRKILETQFAVKNHSMHDQLSAVSYPPHSNQSFMRLVNTLSTSNRSSRPYESLKRPEDVPVGNSSGPLLPANPQSLHYSRLLKTDHDPRSDSAALKPLVPGDTDIDGHTPSTTSHPSSYDTTSPSPHSAFNDSSDRPPSRRNPPSLNSRATSAANTGTDHRLNMTGVRVIAVDRTFKSHPIKNTDRVIQPIEQRVQSLPPPVTPSLPASTVHAKLPAFWLPYPKQHVTAFNPSDRFQIRKPCSLPQQFASRPLEVLQQHPWMQQLKDYLSGLNSTLVSLVSSDFTYREVLLNWLISATVNVSPPLTNILVLSLDESLYKLLDSRGFACIHIPPQSLIRVTLTSHAIGFRQVHIMRLTVMRLINHWGYDVANYDTDAIILKNPEPLYTRSKNTDVIASFGHFPKKIYHMWGVAICTGVVVTRATIENERMWEAMSTVQLTSTNDQLRLNLGILAMNVSWDDTTADISYQQWHGRSRQGAFQVTVLPLSAICRSGNCSPRRASLYYVWHKGGSKTSEGKQKDAYAFWYLRKDWEIRSRDGRSRGVHWLREISVH